MPLEKMTGTTPSDENQVPSINRVGIRLPIFWPQNPDIWFAQVEAQFSIAGISNDQTKFNYIISHLEPQYITIVKELLLLPPSTPNKYERMKEELIKRLSVSKENRVKQLLQHEELGDRKPSQFLRHLQDLAGADIPDDLLQTIWCSRLPFHIASLIASQDTLPLQKLADLADRVHDMTPTSSVNVAEATASTSKPVATTSNTSPALEATILCMSQQIMELSRQVAALSTRVDSRSRPRNRSGRRSTSRSRHRSPSNYRNNPTCWYHMRFGSSARSCVKPCNFSSGNATGDR